MISDLHPAGRRLRLRAFALTLSAGFLLPVIFIFTSSREAFAQPAGSSATSSVSASRATIYLPPGHPAYGTIERLRGAGLLPGAWLNRRPLSRRAVANALQEGLVGARKKGMELLAQEVEWRLQDFVHDLEQDVSGINPRRRPLGIRWEGEEDISLTAEMNLDFGYDTRKDLSPDFKGAFLVKGGVEIYGNVGDAVGYAARYRQASETREGTVRSWSYAREQNIAQLRDFGDYASYTESSGHYSWDGRVFGADLCFDSPAWGPSPDRNLLLSGHAPSFGYLQGRVVFGQWLRYIVLAGSLRSVIFDSLRSYQPDEPASFRDLERQKYIIGQRLDIHPLSSVRFGFTELVIVADRFPELLYFVPTVSIWDAQHYLENPDNTMVGIDVSWTPNGGPHIYGGIAIDEWGVAQTFSDSSSHNWMAFQLGASWTPPFQEGRWSLWVEATRVLPNVYRHQYPVNDWKHADSWLGFWSAQNSEVIQGRLTFLASPRLHLAAWGRYARKGGEVDRLEQYRIPPSEKFMLGMERIGAWVGAAVTYEGLQHWQVTAEVVNAPVGLWPHNRALEIYPPIPASLGQDWQFFLRWTYNPF